MVKKGKKKKQAKAESTEGTSQQQEDSQQQEEQQQISSPIPSDQQQPALDVRRQQTPQSQPQPQQTASGKKKKQAKAKSTEGTSQQQEEQQQISSPIPSDQQQQPALDVRRQQTPQSQPQPQQTASGGPRQVAQGQPQPQRAAQSGPRHQVPRGQPQQSAWDVRHQVPQGQPQPQQSVWGGSQQIPQGQPQLQQIVSGGQQVPQGQPQPQQSVWGGSQQIPQDQPQLQQIVSGGQQVPQGQPQPQQSVWGVPRQQIPQGQPQQSAWGVRQQVPQGQPQPQQSAWDVRQQVPQGQPQPQQSVWGGSQQIPQGQPQLQQIVSGGQQVPQGQPQPQQSVWGGSRQIPQGQPQLQQIVSGGQQVPQGQPQPQQSVWGVPRQQIPQGQPQQSAWSGSQQIPQSQLQPQQTASGGPRQVPQHQQKQQRTSVLPQKQQRASIDIRAAGDHGQVGKQQPSTSSGSIDLSGFSAVDPFHKEKTEKVKMTSDQLKAYHEMIPKRADPQKAGTVGKHITVWTNMFQIIFNDKFVTNAVHYDVTIGAVKKDSKQDPKKEVKSFRLSKMLCRNIFEQCRCKHFKQRFPAYDGSKNAYSANDLPFVDTIRDVFYHVFESGNQKQYEIVIKKVANVDLSWVKNLKPGLAANREQTAVQVLDIIMRHAPESRFVNIGRSLFWNVNEEEPLTGAVCLVRGGFMSGALGWQPFLNLDVSNKGFTMTQKVLSYIAEVLEKDERALTYDNVITNQNKLESFLKGLKVTYVLPNVAVSKRTYRVRNISKSTADSHTFQYETGEKSVTYTITRYFSEIKKYRIQRTDLPTLYVGDTANNGKILVPLELCTITAGQAINKKLDEMQTRNMIKKTATDAFTRKKRIEEAFNKIGVNKSLVMEKEFHLSVSAQMKQVNARVLPPPELQYSGRITSTVAKGIWRLQPFNQAKNLESNSWTILNLSKRQITPEVINNFVKMLQNTAREVGMMIGQPESPYKSIRTDNLRDVTEFFNRYKDLKLIIVIIPNQTDITYGHVKRITEMDVGVLTQCMKFGTLMRANPSTVKNILQKINSKLNGVNHILNTMPLCLSNCPCMLVGADVTHPSPDAKEVPSIAAVAASRNHLAFQYNVALRLQPPKEEMILDLEAIILSQLNVYFQEVKRAPQRIIYYRDGVSEGQLSQVMYYEINSIKNAIRKFNKGGIEVTCLVVQKRHHVRLFPTSSTESDDRNNNVRAGTIVDTTITHPDHIDFYLVSHASIQGTARPTKYRCICNDSNFNEDQLEQLTYYLCHMYARCTRSVSYPAPTYYAHLAAFRGRALLQGKTFKLAELEKEQRNFTMKMSASPMYFV